MNKLSNLTATIGVDIRGILAITNYTLTYTNVTSDTIEAIYQFSLPRMASVLSCEVEINQQRYSAAIKQRSAAARDYESAIQDRKRAVLVESLNDGLYAINMGNLETNQSIAIELRVAQALSASDEGRALTYRLPTNIAPRFGSSNNYIEPEYSLFAQYPFSAMVRSDTPLTISNASHQIVKQAEGYQFSGMLDRDIFFTFAANQHNQVVAGEFNGHEYLLGYPTLNDSEAVDNDRGSVDVHILMDRSGSMQGQSIQQCKQAVKSLINGLSDKNCVNITSFGCQHHAVFTASRALNGKCRKHLRQAVDRMKADMGGTELIDAVVSVLKQKEKSRDVSYLVLITDGQVYISEEAFAAISLLCQQKNVVIHAIGVGYNVSEYVVRGLSVPTGGINTVVNPNGELLSVIRDIAGAVRHSRPVTLSVEGASPQWLCYPRQHYPLLPQLFIASAKKIAIDPDSDVALDYIQEVTGDWAKATVHIAALYHMLDLTQDEAKALAETLGILTKHTSFVMVDQSNYKVKDDALSTRVVPQPLGADVLQLVEPTADYHIPSPQTSGIDTYVVSDIDCDDQREFMDIPSMLCRSRQYRPEVEKVLLTELEHLFWRPTKWDTEYLRTLSFSEDLVDRLSSLSTRFGLPFYVAVLAYLHEVAKKNGVELSGRAKKRITEKTCYLDAHVLEEAYVLSQRSFEEDAAV